MTSPSDLYEDLCQIGKGAFGVIRKVRRKTDGAVCIPFWFSLCITSHTTFCWNLSLFYAYGVADDTNHPLSSLWFPCYRYLHARKSTSREWVKKTGSKFLRKCELSQSKNRCTQTNSCSSSNILSELNHDHIVKYIEKVCISILLGSWKTNKCHPHST